MKRIENIKTRVESELEIIIKMIDSKHVEIISVKKKWNPLSNTSG